MVDNSVVIKIHDLSDDITDQCVAEFFARYGEVRSIRSGVWPKPYPCAGIPDGYRYVTAVLSKPVPSYVSVGGEETLVTYRGQQKTCRKCRLSTHHAMTCTQARKLVAQKANNSERLSYASEVQNGTETPAPETISRAITPTFPASTSSGPEHTVAASESHNGRTSTEQSGAGR
ncbi:uncharacterized protein LOC131263159 [Anopheles coustani]|uniref:uncharacterized protein LOC131263159 n=1 Tax=Anopheles coustani TaxID=139045 RepID=UPI00265931C9|nr:uncharacterized protein LOC131263159 [Anopheles coustani]